MRHTKRIILSALLTGLVLSQAVFADEISGNNSVNVITYDHNRPGHPGGYPGSYPGRRLAQQGEYCSPNGYGAYPQCGHALVCANVGYNGVGICYSAQRGCRSDYECGYNGFCDYGVCRERDGGGYPGGHGHRHHDGCGHRRGGHGGGWR